MSRYVDQIVWPNGQEMAILLPFHEELGTWLQAEYWAVGSKTTAKMMPWLWLTHLWVGGLPHQSSGQLQLLSIKTN